MKILADYERVSGQVVSLRKFAITFGSNVVDSNKTRLRRILDIHNEGGFGKYLDYLSSSEERRKKKELFNYIVRNVK